MNEEKFLSSKLQHLYNHLINGLEEDLEEATDNIDAYFELIDGDPDQRALYGTLYNDSLKIKGTVRERYLKTINSIKERVGKLENDRIKDDNKKEGGDNLIDFNHNEVSDMLKEMKKSGSIKSENLNVEKIKEENDYENKEDDENEELEYIPKKEE